MYKRQRGEWGFHGIVLTDWGGSNDHVEMCIRDRAAVNGAKATEQIVARMGRAGTVGKRSMGYPDAGAYALGVIFSNIAQEMTFA